MSNQNHNRTIRRHILICLNEAGTYATPEDTLIGTISDALRPPPAHETVIDNISWCIDQGFIAILPDPFDKDARKLLITEQGKVALKQI